MKRIVLLLCGIILCGALSYAQEPEDWGGYIVSTTTTVNFREGPDIGYEVIRKLPKDTELFIEKGSEVNGFYPAILLATDEFGYVSTSYVKKQMVIKSEHGNLFDEVLYSDNKEPVVRVRNDSPYTISVSIGATRNTISPHSEQSITCSAGTLRTVVSAPGVMPFMATDLLENNYTYTWTFYIKTRKY